VAVLENAEILEIDAGEQNKNLDIVHRLWEVLAENNVDRQALIVNLGGGMITDLGGFMASVYKRGIRFINVPSSLLAMVDAAVGGKTGIDLGNLKNQLGCFTNPQAVCVWSGFLETLPINELNSGYGELIKYALIDKDKLWEDFWEQGFQEVSGLTPFIQKALEIKMEIVRKDLYESGLRKVLNFGHTYGHALESLALKKGNPMMHGEAVALGIICELWHSVRRYNFPEDRFEQIKAFILDGFSKPQISEEDFEQIIGFMQKDKKNHSDKIAIVLLEDLGVYHVDESLSPEEVEECLQNFIRF
jgi:3-dehydroquinate synthase